MLPNGSLNVISTGEEEINQRIVTVTIDRLDGSNIQEAKAVIEQVLAALRPLEEQKLVRLRVTRAKETLVEDAAWQVSQRVGSDHHDD